jgi:hypothetical protein
MDIDTMEPGLDFVEVIEQAMGSCDALIALIGRQWLTITDDSGRRLDNPETSSGSKSQRRLPAIFESSPRWSTPHACRAPQTCRTR